MAMPRFESVTDYLAAQSEEGRAAIAVVRDLILARDPEAEERLSYGIPTFFVGGRRLLHTAGWGEHLAIYPIPASPPGDAGLREDLTPYIKGKGTLHFRYAVPLPSALLARIVDAHLARLPARPNIV